jgi:hypothetical protein
MADPLSTTSGIVAILQATKAVISYLRDVDEANEHKTRILLELSAIRGILQTINNFTTNATKGDSLLRNIEGLAAPLAEYQSLLSLLEKVLEPSQGLNRIGKALKWSFESKNVLEGFATIERLDSWDETKAEASEVDAQGKTLAHWAAELGEPEVYLELLNLQSRHTVFMRDNRGPTVMDYA